MDNANIQYDDGLYNDDEISQRLPLKNHINKLDV